MLHRISIIALSLSAFFLASCDRFTSNSAEKFAINAHPVEGEWVDNHGIISNFHNGMMETHAPDTQEKLAEGNYVFTSPSQMTIELRSLVRGTIFEVRCNVSNNAQSISCKSTEGASFTLSRNT